MRSFARSLAIVAALISLAVGIRDGVRLPGASERELRWAPIPAGAEVALLATPLPGQETDAEPLFEAVARRPDVAWHLFDRTASQVAPDVIVVVGAAVPPAGWQPRWRSGQVLVLERER
jgi:hypothetical protein